jgi:hypothetical protein
VAHANSHRGLSHIPDVAAALQRQVELVLRFPS